jgi:hypothetical protein
MAIIHPDENFPENRDVETLVLKGKTNPKNMGQNTLSAKVAEN